MALRLSGVTRASALGPINTFMESHGGSIARVLQREDLPFAIIDQRDLIVPLKAQFRLLERAARDTGDVWFGARLGQVVRGVELSAFGAWVCAAPTLRGAIARSHAGLNVMLQTSTILTFSERNGVARWSIEFVEPESEGRHHNEFLGLGYMMDVIRLYAGPRWVPNVVFTALSKGSPRGELEAILRTNISHGHAVPALEFDAALLARHLCRPAGRPDKPPERDCIVPSPGDVVANVEAVIDLAMSEGQPRVAWVAAKLGTTCRSLQRSLQQRGTSFNWLTEAGMERRARQLLSGAQASVTDVALQLGYSDTAHFTRAFRRWTGVTPSAFRNGDNSERVT